MGPWPDPASGLGPCPERELERPRALWLPPHAVAGSSEGGRSVLEAVRKQSGSFHPHPSRRLRVGEKDPKGGAESTPALKQTWKGRGSVLGKARASSVSLSQQRWAYSVGTLVGLRGIHCSLSMLALLCESGYVVSRNTPLCFHDRKPPVINFSGPLLALALIQITCRPSDFTTVSLEIAMYIGIIQLLLICLFQSDFPRCQ